MESYFRLARNTAFKSPSRFRLGAVLVRKRKPISTGFNIMNRTHTLMDRYNVSNKPIGIHAEIHACLGIPFSDLAGTEIYIYRVLKNGNQALSKPCLTCQRFLRTVGIVRAFYSLDGAGIGELEL